MITITHICPLELQAGDPLDYAIDIIKMLQDYYNGNYTDITDVPL